MESNVDPSHETTEILGKIEGLATSQTRMEVLLVAIHKDLSSLAMQHKLDEGQVMKTQSWAEEAEDQDQVSPPEVPTTELCGEDKLTMTTSTPDESCYRVKFKEVAEGMPGSLVPTIEPDGEAELTLRQFVTRSISDLQSYHMKSKEAEDEVPDSLPRNWPACVGISLTMSSREGQHQDKQKSSDLYKRGDDGLRTGIISTMRSAISFACNDLDKNVRVMESEGVLGSIIVNPNSTFHSVHSMASLFVLMHDLLLIPYILAWDLALEGAMLVASWAACCFWTLDVLLICITGIESPGRLEMRPYFVMRNYAKSWLLPDVAVVISDWLSLVLAASFSTEESSSGIRSLGFAKAGKLLRLFSLLRMLRVVRIIEESVDSRLSDFARTVLRCVLLVLGMLWFNHLVGCAWFAIGRMAPSDTGLRWTDTSKVLNGQEVSFMDQDLLHQYIASLHWSFAQFTLGAMDIEACNSIERTYNIACMALGLIFSSTLVSTLSASMVEYQMTRNDQIQRLRKLRRFLRDNNISRSVSSAVQQQAQERLSMQSKIHESEVSALPLLSTSLRTTLRYEMFKPHLCQHAFFRLWMDMDCSLARELSMKAMMSTMLRPHDDLFVPGGSPDTAYVDTAYVLLSGNLVYTQEPSTAPVDHVTAVSVPTSRWFSEAALWTQWVHVGTAKARTPCQIVSISASPLAMILRKPTHASTAEICMDYCRAFHRRIVTARPPHSSWPTDLEVPFEYSDLVFGMDQDTQVSIGFRALELLQSRRRTMTTQRTISHLDEEIRSGKSCVMINAEGKIERVVSVVALDMRNSQGQILAQVGNKKGPAPISGSCQLPGLKQEAGEMLSSTLARLLSRFYLELEDVKVVNVERTVQWKQSKEHGVHTKYIRFVHHINILQELPIPSLALSRITEQKSMHSRMDALATRWSNISEPTSYAFSATLGDWLNSLPWYKFEDDNKTLFFTWLAPEQFGLWASPSGEKELRHVAQFLNGHNLEDLAF